MLVLTRRKDESILIGEEIVLTVRDIRLDGVRLDMTCPAGVALRLTGSPGAVGGDPQTGKDPAGPRVIGMDLPADQALRIGEVIKVTIEGLYFTDGLPTRLRLGIQAPREIPILREEIRGT